MITKLIEINRQCEKLKEEIHEEIARKQQLLEQRKAELKTQVDELAKSKKETLQKKRVN